MAQPPLAEKGLTSLLDLLGCGGVDHVGVVSRDLVVEALGRMGEQVAVLVHRAALRRNPLPDRRESLLQARRSIHNDEGWPAQLARDKIVEHRPPGGLRLSAHVLDRPMFLTASRTFWPSSRMPMTTSSEMEVALRSSRTRTTVPSRINRTIGSSARERWFQACQSVCTLRQTRLTVSLPTAPPNRAASARRTRRVLVPARYAEAISASAALVRR